MHPIFKLLIVEHSENFRLVIKELLKSQFRSVVIEEAASGEEALTKIQGFLPDCIFMDGDLPDCSGLEITKTIRAVYGSRIGIIFLTSQDQDTLKQAALECGGQGTRYAGRSR